VAVVLAWSVLAGAGAAQLIIHGSLLPGQSAALNRAAGAGSGAPRTPHGPAGRTPSAGGTKAHPTPAATSQPSRPARRRRPRHSSPRPSPSATAAPTAAPTATSTASGYANPLRGISGLIPERIDQGVDFGGSGPIYALGNAVITYATDQSSGWPGGGWITYRLTSGPARGLEVYVAEDVTPSVQVGQVVTSSTVIANMFNGSAGIETGWAQPDGLSAESQLPVAGSIDGAGPFPTSVGMNFEYLLQSLGVPTAYNRDFTAFGVLPAGYPTTW
jgi:hypothetical protein